MIESAGFVVREKETNWWKNRSNIYEKRVRRDAYGNWDNNIGKILILLGNFSENRTYLGKYFPDFEQPLTYNHLHVLWTEQSCLILQIFLIFES